MKRFKIIFTGLNGPRQHAGLLPESMIWAYVVQLSSALRAIHAAGLAFRTMDPSKILIYSKSRSESISRLTRLTKKNVIFSHWPTVGMKKAPPQKCYCCKRKCTKCVLPLAINNNKMPLNLADLIIFLRLKILVYFKNKCALCRWCIYIII